jgi:hypothetical protein
MGSCISIDKIDHKHRQIISFGKETVTKTQQFDLISRQGLFSSGLSITAIERKDLIYEAVIMFCN